MEKAFDRIEWKFLTEVLRRFRFTDEFIDLVDACNRENHFSLLVNDTSTPFFTTTRGLWQGDLLSPTLFILVEEVLGRTLSRAVSRGLIQPYHSKRGCPIISHSLFADDAILFLNRCEASIKGLMTIISSYERAIGQFVNISKSNFIVASSTTISTIRRIQDITRFSRGHLPFYYLGCLIFLGCTRIHYFDTLLCKLRKKLTGWKLQLLSSRGRIQLIRHVLMSMPLHLLAVHEVPDTILQFVRRICTLNFFLSPHESFSLINVTFKRQDLSHLTSDHAEICFIRFVRSHKNSGVKRARVGAVLGWVTSLRSPWVCARVARCLLFMC
ncbi:unnamed protein product [Spirodela intermedia]|uniref:Reverse transcriptase domain-containing protein n=1 Tax=Spirodela intermedia TaxID=51605 RepID=A0A7I8LJD1_SPIIN|nr:unnamed protein product [Spirodela intermedia]